MSQLLENYSFKSVKSVKPHGQMSAVSDDGKVIVYQRKKDFWVYFQESGSIIEKQFSLDFSPTGSDEEFYQEPNPFSTVLVTQREEKILVFAFEMNGQNVAKVQLEKAENSTAQIQYQTESSSEVLDVDLHPTQNSLVVLKNNSVQLIFRDNPPSDYQISVPQNFSFNIGSIIATVEDDLPRYYIFSQDQDNNSLRTCKITQLEAAVLYDISHCSSFHLSFSNSRISFKALQYDNISKIAALTIEEQAEFQNDIETFYINCDLSQLTAFGTSEAQFFNQFSKEKTSMVLANYQENNLKKICIVPFQASNQTASIEYVEGQKCFDGNFHHIATWKNGQDYILMKTDRNLSIMTTTTGEQVFEENVFSFSTKNPDYLIVDTYDQLHYIQIGKTSSEVQEEFDDVSATVIIMFIMGSIIFIQTCILVWMCAKKKLRNLNKNKNEGKKHKKQKGKRKRKEKEKKKNSEKNPWAGTRSSETSSETKHGLTPKNSNKPQQIKFQMKEMQQIKQIKDSNNSISYLHG